MKFHYFAAVTNLTVPIHDHMGIDQKNLAETSTSH